MAGTVLIWPRKIIYKDRSDANLTFNFVFDKVEGRWLIKKASAERYGQLYNTYWTINLSKISAAEAEKAFEGIIDGLARGETDQPYYSYDMDNIMIFDDSYPRDPEVYEAALEFTKAYYSYIEDHGINDRVCIPHPLHRLAVQWSIFSV